MYYNPYAPNIIGQEWCPIREENLALPSFVEDTSVGYTFSADEAYTLTEGRWYLPEPNPSSAFTYWGIEVTEGGQEANVGPVRRVIIPCNNGTSTGGANISVSTSVAASLFNANDSLNISAFFGTDTFYASDPDPAFTAYFAGSAFSGLLQGKRILGINVLYSFSISSSEEFIEEFGIGDASVTMSLATDSASFSVASTELLPTAGSTLDITRDLLNDAAPAMPMYRAKLPGLNPYWNGVTNPVAPDFEYLHWLPVDLARFESSASQRYGIKVSYDASDSTASAGASSEWRFMALEVFYCEENRVACGSRLTLPTYMGANKMTMRTLARAANPVIGPGVYTVNFYRPSTSSAGMANDAGPYPALAALRQLYAIPTLGGVNVKRPFPLDGLEDVDRTFEATETDIIPQITLHDTGGPIEDIHPYGRQAIAQVYGSVTAAQELYDNIAGGARTYPQVRYYARKWGDTNVPLELYRASDTTQKVSITPAEHDALPEILDGWKEVTLRFDTTVTFGTGSNPNWTWAAPGELSANRWEILGAGAPALSGLPGNFLTLAPSPHQLGGATYGAQSSGSTITATWVPGFSPIVTASTPDAATDLTILFSTDPATPTGLDVSPLSQALSYTDPDCPVDPACIPTELFYNQLSWTPVSGASADDFSRVVASGWGSNNLGQAWSVSGGTATYVDGSAGIAEMTSGAVTVTALLSDIKSPDVEARMVVSVDTLNATDQQFELVLRRTDGNNYYRMVAEFDSNGTIDLRFSKIVAGVSTHVVTAPDIADMTWGPNVRFTLKARVAGQYVAGKIWPEHMDEPSAWQIFTTDTSLTTGNSAGTVLDSGSISSGTITWSVHDWYIQPSDFGALELQRYDPVDAEFSTIMLASSAAVTGFSDYEARVGQDSVYRLRQRNVYDFAGLWSDQVTGGITSPGVVGGEVALLLFTSNYNQDGSTNLAYSAEWEGDPDESFNWPEGQQVVLQSMYRKNYPTAFRPLERGGESFVRNILVNAAGVPEPVTRNGFNDLRDMAWDTVPYVCVRDELGNRWYSTVIVPEGRRKRMVNKGHLNTAQVQVVEVTDAPYPVDPT